VRADEPGLALDSGRDFAAPCPFVGFAAIPACFALIPFRETIGGAAADFRTAGLAMAFA
jgi:hypothetical protein